MPVFLIQVHLVLVVVFLASFAVSELVLRASAERHLPLPVRIGFGYVITVAFFAAVMEFISAQIAWFVALLVLLVLTVLRRSLLRQAIVGWRSYVLRIVRVGAAYIVLANVFLLPEHIAQNYGPFTEGGGDVSIYADLAKYTTDQNMAIWGPGDVYRELAPWLSLLSGQVTYSADDVENLRTFDPILGNPPTASAQPYRVALIRRYPSLTVSPIAQWGFLPFATTYPIFYGVMAFQWAGLVLAAGAALRQFGRVPSVFAMTLIMASHGLISVYYNVYFMQGLSLMLAGLVLAGVPTIAVLSWPGMRTVGLCLAIVMCGYLHFATVIGPLLLLRIRPIRYTLSRRGHIVGGWAEAAPEIAADTTVGALLAVWLLTSLSRQFVLSWGSITVLVSRLARFVSIVPTDTVTWQPTGGGDAASIDAGFLKASSALFGDSVKIGSGEWLSFLFGSLSQQHYPPFAVLSATVLSMTRLASVAGLVLLFMGTCVAFVALAQTIRTRHEGKFENAKRATAAALFSLAAIATIAHLAIVQTSMYTQAKGAQDVLPLVLVVLLVVPFGVLWSGASAFPGSRSLGLLMGAILVVFLCGLAVPRVSFALKLSRQQDRATVLEQSAFDQAAIIEHKDPLALVLFEPKNVSDIYVNTQAFFGYRMVPTQYLVLQQSDDGLNAKRASSALQFVAADDLQHLWTLSARRVREQSCVFNLVYDCPRYEWMAVEVALTGKPELLLAGNQSTRFLLYQRLLRGSPDLGWFSYLHSGDGAVVIPPSTQPHNINVVVRPSTESQAGHVRSETFAFLDQLPLVHELAPVGNDDDIAYSLMVPASREPTYVPVISTSSELLVNVRVDGMELQPVTQLSQPKPARAGGTLAIHWSDVVEPTTDDWIGLFPLDGNDADRIIFAFTGGGESGAVEIPVPSGLEPGSYEVRMYKHGTWQELAVKQVEIGSTN
jgi:hypothetical protein